MKHISPLLAVGIVAAFALAGCASSAPHPAPPTSQQKFIAKFEALDSTDKVPANKRAALAKQGKLTCKTIAEPGSSLSRLGDSILRGGVREEYVEALLTASVSVYCPNYTSDLKAWVQEQ